MTRAALEDLISAAERRAMAAERDTVDRLIAAYLAERVDDRFDARILDLQAIIFDSKEVGFNWRGGWANFGASYYQSESDFGVSLFVDPASIVPATIVQDAERETDNRENDRAFEIMQQGKPSL